MKLGIENLASLCETLASHYIFGVDRVKITVTKQSYTKKSLTHSSTCELNSNCYPGFGKCEFFQAISEVQTNFYHYIFTVHCHLQ